MYTLLCPLNNGVSEAQGMDTQPGLSQARTIAGPDGDPFEGCPRILPNPEFDPREAA
jgi:hypothetical protein